MHNFYIKHNFQISNRKFPHAYMATKLRIMRYVTVFQCYAVWLEKVDKGDTWVCLLICTHKARALSFSTTLCFTIISRWTFYQASVYMQCCKPAIRQEGNSQAPRPGTCPPHFGQGVHEAIFCPFLLSTLEWFKHALSPIQIRFTTKGRSKLGAPTVQKV